MIETIADLASILTAVIAFFWFLYTKRMNYFEKGNIVGVYKIFDSLINRKDNELAIIEFNINHISNNGWFVGKIDYSEIFKPIGARSEGDWACIGYIRYNLFNDFLFLFKSRNKNPLLYDRLRGFKGELYIISRNDFNIETTDWKTFLIESFELIHYRNTYRISLSNKELHSKTKTQLPDNIFLVNTTVVKDNMYE